MDAIPVTKPWFDDDEARRVLEVLRSGWVAQGPQVEAFERRFAARCGVDHAVAVSSGTAALHLALLASGIVAGDEVLVPSFTWVATANAVRYCGATPVLCDVDLRTFNIDVADARRRVTSRTQAIVPVHQFGLPADMDAVTTLAEEHGLTLIGDAACAFGAAYRDRVVGRLAPIEIFSFHPRKAITTGEGGMIATMDAEVAARLRSLRNHGSAMDGGKPATPESGESLLVDMDVLGFNYRMTDLQAAVGLAQLDKADRILEARSAQAAWYTDALRELAWLLPPDVPADCRHAWQSYIVLLASPGGDVPTLGDLPELNARRNRIVAELEQHGIGTRQGTHAVHTLDLYRRPTQAAPEALPNALLADRLSFCLPLYYGLTTAEQDRVITVLREAYAATQ